MATPSASRQMHVRRDVCVPVQLGDNSEKYHESGCNCFGPSAVAEASTLIGGRRRVNRMAAISHQIRSLPATHETAIEAAEIDDEIASAQVDCPVVCSAIRRRSFIITRFNARAREGPGGYFWLVRVQTDGQYDDTMRLQVSRCVD